MSEIGLVEVSGGGTPGPPVGSAAALDLADSPTVMLRFLVSADGQDSLEALRNARRSLLREERTRGRDPDEPSLEDAIFSATEILWVVLPGQRNWCLQKLEELRRRANQLLTKIEAG